MRIVDEYRLTVPAEASQGITLLEPNAAVPVRGDAARLEEVLHNGKRTRTSQRMRAAPPLSWPACGPRLLRPGVKRLPRGHHGPRHIQQLACCRIARSYACSHS